jgi:hypothetical protein
MKMDIRTVDISKKVPYFLFLLMFALPNQTEAVDAYQFSDNMVAVEAEKLQFSSAWQSRTDKSGYTGSGWLMYTGPQQVLTPADADDANGSLQGNESDWLKIPVLMTAVGLYSVQIHCYHTVSFPADPCKGDASVWTHVKGYPNPVRYSHGETISGANTFKFLGFGPAGWMDPPEDMAVPGHATFRFTSDRLPAVVTFYVAGRSRNFGVDRVHIYMRTGALTLKHDAYPENYINKNAPLSTKITTTAPLYEVGKVTPILTPSMAQRDQTTLLSMQPAGMFDLSGRQMQRRSAVFVTLNPGYVGTGMIR